MFGGTKEKLQRFDVCLQVRRKTTLVTNGRSVGGLLEDRPEGW